MPFPKNNRAHRGQANEVAKGTLAEQCEARASGQRVVRQLDCSRGPHHGLKRTTGRCGFRRATSEKPALSYMDFAPNHMDSSFERLGLSTG